MRGIKNSINKSSEGKRKKPASWNTIKLQNERPLCSERTGNLWHRKCSRRHCGKQLKSLGGMKYHVIADHNNQTKQFNPFGASQPTSLPACCNCRSQ